MPDKEPHPAYKEAPVLSFLPPHRGQEGERKKAGRTIGAGLFAA
jgi:hypothetical protein